MMNHTEGICLWRDTKASLHIILIKTSMDECVRNILYRRAVKGNTTQFSEKNMRTFMSNQLRAENLAFKLQQLGAHLYDIRAIGAHSPIRCLMLLHPERVDDLMTGECGCGL